LKSDTISVNSKPSGGAAARNGANCGFAYPGGLYGHWLFLLTTSIILLI
jgi:hypothetical protein